MLFMDPFMGRWYNYNGTIDKMYSKAEELRGKAEEKGHVTIREYYGFLKDWLGSQVSIPPWIRLNSFRINLLDCPMKYSFYLKVRLDKTFSPEGIIVYSFF